MDVSALHSGNLIDCFINDQLSGRGLDERTKKAYRLDLEHLYGWLEKEETFGTEYPAERWEEKIEAYLTYLSREKKLRISTIARKFRVFGYYRSYLIQQGLLSKNTESEKMKLAVKTIKEEQKKLKTFLSKQEVDRFFRAIEKEYELLDSDFRRRVCLRDQVMMELLFYHGIEISELLNLEVKDYDSKTGILTVHKKRGRECVAQLFSKTLQGQMEQWLEEHVYFEHDEEYYSRMFLSKLGKPLSMKMIINIFDKYRILAGIEKEYTPKDLKKSMERYAKELMMEQCG